MERKFHVWCRTMLLSSALLLGSSCSRQHTGPQVGDSVTNWLHACAQDSECGRRGVCMHSVCSLPCSGTPSDNCSRLDPRAICDTRAQVCDLPCETSSACELLSATFVCRAGRCRPSEPGEAALTPVTQDASPPPALAAGSVVPFDEQLRPEAGSNRAMATLSVAMGQANFDRAQPVILATLGSVIAGLGSSWQEDHWQIIWPFLDQPVERVPHFTLARIYPDGRYETRDVTIPFAPPSIAATVYSKDGSAAFLGAGRGATSCSITVSELARGVSYAPSYFSCGDGPVWMASPVPKTGEWWLSWRPPSSATTPAHAVLVALYDPSETTNWHAGPWLVGSDTDALPGITAAEENVYLWPMDMDEGNYLYRLHDLAPPEQADPAFVPSVDGLSPFAGEAKQLVALESGVVTFAQAGSELIVTPSYHAGDSAEPAAIALEAEGKFEALYLRERDQIAVCTAHSDVQLHILDRQGKALTEPLVVAPPGKHTACTLAWSGSDLVLAWATELPADGEGVPLPAGTQFWAQIIPTTSLTR